MTQKPKSLKQIDFEGGPRFTLIITYSPSMNNRKLLSNLLETATVEAESKIKGKYSENYALPLIKKFRELIKNIRTVPKDKTLAIFVSCTTKNVYLFTPTKVLPMPSTLRA